MKYTTYLFDFDYTLADSSRGIVTCFRIVLERHQYTDITDEAIKRTIGKTLEESFSILTGITDSEQLAAFRQEYSKESDTYMNVNTFLFPETISTLTQLKNQGARIGIISTKYRHRILGFLKDHLPEDFFDIVIGGEDVQKPKPNPEGLFLAIERLSVLPEETLYIGDSTVDAETAATADVAFAGVTSGMTTAEELAAYPHTQVMDNLACLVSPELPVPSRKQRKYSLHTLKAIIRQVHIRQIRGRQFSPPVPDTCTCRNCGHSFTGSYCPNCGQNRDTPRFVIRSAVKNVLGGMTNIDSGFGYTLIELLTRPGYMIHDFMAGKRVRYFRPFQTMFVLAAIYILLVQIIDPKALEEEKNTSAKQELTEAYLEVKKETQHADTSQEQLEYKNIARNLKVSISKLDSLLHASEVQQKKEAEDEDEVLDKMIESTNKFRKVPFIEAVTDLLGHWAHGNKALLILCLVPLLALSTQWAFRKRTFNRQYNFTELLFAQTYMACQILLISIFYFPFNGKADLSSAYDLPWWVVFILSIWVYKQLFRGSWIKTVKRTTLMYVYCLCIITVVAVLALTLLVLAGIATEAISR